MSIDYEESIPFTAPVTNSITITTADIELLKKQCLLICRKLDEITHKIIIEKYEY